tara:strand:- start:961 stop:1458 length:498 start_codon:yes stop_codon:yes gene_type:complete
MTEYRQVGAKSSWIWGNKHSTIAYIKKNRKMLHTNMVRIIKAKKKDMALDLIMLFLEIPGFGLPKAGFCVQLVAGKAGCLDVHNIRKYLPNEDARKGTPSWLQTSGNSIKTKRKKAIMYLELCDAIGGARFLWNQWCDHISSEPWAKYVFPTGYDVSEVHTCIWN